MNQSIHLIARSINERMNQSNVARIQPNPINQSIKPISQSTNQSKQTIKRSMSLSPKSTKPFRQPCNQTANLIKPSKQIHQATFITHQITQQNNQINNQARGQYTKPTKTINQAFKQSTNSIGQPSPSTKSQIK